MTMPVTTMTRSQQHQRRKAMAIAVQGGLGVAEVSRNFEMSMYAVMSACRQYETIVPVAMRREIPRSVGKRMAVIAALVNTSESFHAIARKHVTSHQWVRLVYMQGVEVGLPMADRSATAKRQEDDPPAVLTGPGGSFSRSWPSRCAKD